jgi:hypothetical protein
MMFPLIAIIGNKSNLLPGTTGLFAPLGAPLGLRSPASIWTERRQMEFEIEGVTTTLARAMFAAFEAGFATALPTKGTSAHPIRREGRIFRLRPLGRTWRTSNRTRTQATAELTPSPLIIEFGRLTCPCIPGCGADCPFNIRDRHRLWSDHQ